MLVRYRKGRCKRFRKRSQLERKVLVCVVHLAVHHYPCVISFVVAGDLFGGVLLLGSAHDWRSDLLPLSCLVRPVTQAPSAVYLLTCSASLAGGDQEA